MARIRTIKPEYYTHPETLALSIPARLLQAALWNQADDEGRLYDQPTKIAGNTFGEDDDIDVRALLAELAEWGRIIRYEVDGRRIIQCVNFRKHQRIDKPRPSSLPTPTGFVQESSAKATGDIPEASRGEWKGMEEEWKGRDYKTIGEAFERFWVAYPTEGRRDKPKARALFVAALKRRVDPADIIAGATRYAADPNRGAEFPHQTSTKYAQGWLSGERWNDPPLAPRGNAPQVSPHEARTTDLMQRAIDADRREAQREGIRSLGAAVAAE